VRSRHHGEMATPGKHFQTCFLALDIHQGMYVRFDLLRERRLKGSGGGWC
jgi:transposase